MTTEPINLVAVQQRTLMRKVWDKLGFGHHYPEPSPSEDDPRFAPGALMVECKYGLDWKDRLRILVSGRVVVRTRTITDVPIGVAISRSSFSIGRPGEAL